MGQVCANKASTAGRSGNRSGPAEPATSARGLDVIRVVVTASPGASLTRAAIIEHCRRNLAEYKVPRAVEIAEAAPVDATGKMAAAWAASSNELSNS